MTAREKTVRSPSSAHMKTMGCIDTSRTPDCVFPYSRRTDSKDNHNNQLGSSCTLVLHQSTFSLIPSRRTSRCDE